METRYIELSLDTAQKWYQQGGELKDMALEVYTIEELGYKLPTTWEELEKALNQWGIELGRGTYCDINPQIAAVKKLIQLRNFYNNNWKPNWDNLIEDKFAIDMGYKTDTGTFEYSVLRVYKPSSFLVFNNPKHAEEFLNNFREFIEQAGDLI